MGIFNRKKEERATLEEVLLSAALVTDTITVENALSIPTVAACVALISNTVAMIPINLYQEKDGETKPILDNRVKLLNDDTRDTLDGFQFKKAIVKDYLLRGAGYAYIKKEKNKVKSIHYVKRSSISINANVDPVFKDYDILVNGKSYRPFEFIKVLRDSENGSNGKSVIDESCKAFLVAYNTLAYENILVKTGGNKKGFLKAKNKLSTEAMEVLKEAWNNLYKNNTENVVILNDGLEFQEGSNTAIELQLNENKKTNATEICKIFNVPASLLEGAVSDEIYNNFIKIAILPILKAFETALNRELLLESEKGSFYFVFDTTELLKGNVEQRYKAYSEAVKAGWLSKNEIRDIENLESISGLDIITMSLGEVIFDINSKQYFTPNMGEITGLGINKTNDVSQK